MIVHSYSLTICVSDVIIYVTVLMLFLLYIVKIGRPIGGIALQHTNITLLNEIQ